MSTKRKMGIDGQGTSWTHAGVNAYSGIRDFHIVKTFILNYATKYSEGPATGHLDTGFSWFPCVYKQMLRWFPRFQVATTCFSCSPPDLNLVVTNFMFCLHVK